ncbi:SAV_2336 N-terminal domain-related protein, partial [Streptomyces sp. NPDC000075]|uniref:SAV_2336 N-terminal domain-related protein n=1 Tax=Streptomyces sp. NPDC000075 TaxID=3154241 RepID=UPI00332ECD5F
APASVDAASRPPDAHGPPPGPAPAPGPGAVQLFPAATRPGPPAGHADAEGTRRGVPLRLPRTASLDDPLGLMRALRPVGRRSIGGPGEELDEQLTVERSIEAMIPTPVLRPAESRWLDLALVVDAHPSMLLWADLAAELRGVLTRSGVFRDVRTWQLTGTGPAGTPQLARGPGEPPRNPLELADPAGRRLILVLSDTVAGGWREGPLRAVLRHWSGHNAVAVLNVLPERLWSRGAVRPVPFAVRSDRPAAATRSWQRVPAARRARGGGPVVPVVGLASGSLARLVRVVSGDGRWRRLACLRLDAAAGPPAAAPLPSADPLEVVERFRAGASPTAQRLAAHLAAVPLTLPVMTLVRRSLLRGSEHGHLAEVALGGLFAPWDGHRRPEETEFEFLPGVREALLGSQLRGDVAAVRELVRRRVWEFMSRNRGTGPDFSATRVTTGQAGRRPVPDGALPFAERRPDPGPAEPAPVAGPRAPVQAQTPVQTQTPAPDAGLADRVVRVRFEPLTEPKEVGTLLGPRLVLAVGNVPRPQETVAWVRSGGREIPCQPVWWDYGTPRVLLLESGEDLVEPAGLVPQAWGTLPDAAEARVRVDGLTEAGLRTALTGVLDWDGAPNGELVRLSVEPETWTHFVGGPLSSEGALLGVVHTVEPDRMVFLSGAALMEQPSFRAALDARTQPAPHRGGVVVGPRVTVDVRVVHGAVPRAPLAQLMTDPLIGGTLLGGAGPRTLHLVLEPPGALGRAGRLLGALPTALATYGDTPAQDLPSPLAVVLGIGEPGRAPEPPARLIGHDLIAERLRRARRARTGRLLLALSQPLYEELGALAGPTALSAFTPLGDGVGAWVSEGDPRQLGELLARAERSVRNAAVAWLRCRTGASGDRPQGCPGIRPPGLSACLAHLPPGEQEAVLSGLRPGDPLDFRGVPFGAGLLRRVLDAVRDPETGRPVLGAVAFEEARFDEGWAETGAVFTGEADFSGTWFDGPADFSGAAFQSQALFGRAVFRETATFGGSLFAGPADFGRTAFTRGADFSGVTWTDQVSFQSALLEDGAALTGMRVEGRADFRRVRSGGRMVLDGSRFAGPAQFEHAVWAGTFSAVGTRFGASAGFGDAVCRGEALFRDTRFDGPATFVFTAFEGAVRFDTSTFAASVVFSRAAFGGPALFTHSVCRHGVSFDQAVFSSLLRWRDMTVENEVSRFEGARFQGPARFQRADFATATGFDDAIFDAGVSIEDSEFRAGLTFEGTSFHATAEFTGIRLSVPLSLPGDWSATSTDTGLWNITSPHPAASHPEEPAPAEPAPADPDPGEE